MAPAQTRSGARERLRASCFSGQPVVDHACDMGGGGAACPVRREIHVKGAQGLFALLVEERLNPGFHPPGRKKPKRFVGLFCAGGFMRRKSEKPLTLG
ncbi:MAG: hypothetical protein ACXIVG_09580 [Pararhodobacter sp.]